MPHYTINDLRAFYDDECRHRGMRVLVNRAVRSEVRGGGDCFDALVACYQLSERLFAQRHEDADKVRAALELLEQVAASMRSEIARRYHIGWQHRPAPRARDRTAADRRHVSRHRLRAVLGVDAPIAG